MLDGYKTYIVLGIAILKQLVLGPLGITIAEGDLNTAINVFLLLGAGVFRYIGAKRDKATV